MKNIISISSNIIINKDFDISKINEIVFAKSLNDLQIIITCVAP